MLNYDEDSQSAKVLASHYANLVGDKFLVDFMTGKVDISSQDQLQSVIDGFWGMTDLAIQDNEDGKTIAGVVDIEFWMHKLFIKVNGYMTKNGFGKQWDAAMNER